MAERYNEVTNRLASTREDKSNPAVDHIVVGADAVYDDNYPLVVNGYVDCDTTPIDNPTGNPHEQGWCEEEVVGGEGTGKYILTEDTSVEEGKDYYKPIGAKQDVINNQLRTTISDSSGVVLHANEYNEATIHEGDNPQANGWYEFSGTTYVLTTDTTVVSGKTYYIRVTKITSEESKIINKEDGYVPTAGAVGRAMGANFEDNLQSTSIVKGLTANMGRVLDENKADINGYYETMSVGSAKNLDGENTNSEAYLIRPSGGENNEVANGLASVIGLKGESAVFCQMVASSLRSGSNEIADTRDNNTAYIQLRDRTSEAVTIAQFYITTPQRKKFIATIPNNCNNIDIIRNGGSYLFNILPSIHSDIASHKLYFVIDFTSIDYNYAGGYKWDNLQAFDLTLMGIDNLTTVAEIESWLAQHPGLKPYYAYNKGEILSAKTLGIKTYGQNLLNPTTRQAKLIPYSWEDNSNVYTIKNIPSGATATFTPDATGVAETVDISGGSLDITSYGSGILEMSAATANTYVCMKYDGAKDDEVVPYKENTYNFDVRNVYGKTGDSDEYVQCFPNGIRSAGSVYDILTANEAVVRIGEVDLGDASVSYIKYGTNYRLNLPLKKQGTKFLCSKYKYKGTIGGWGAFDIVTDVGLYVKGMEEPYYIGICPFETYESVNAFKAAHNGVMLNYELITPVTYTDLIYRDGDIDRPLREVLVNLNVDNWSMEEQLITDYDEQGNPTSVPATIQTKYSIDAVEEIKTLKEITYTETEVRATFGNLLECINENCSSVLGGTFAIDPEVSGKTLDFTFTENASTNSTEENTETI